ncbi:MAG: Na+/H+ antiporter NhaA, partial [Rickettsiales bacterium]|nr:Na+/H+ antiporter NhaA [Rickettsiales bacterium]
MSLFIGSLAFSNPEFATYVRLGVLSGSFLSAALGITVLLLSTKSTKASSKNGLESKESNTLEHASS